MTLQSRLAALVGAIGADIKDLDTRLDAINLLAAISSLSASTYTGVVGSAGGNVIMSAASITLTPGTWLVMAEANCATNTADGVSCGLYDQTLGAAIAGSYGPAGTCPTAGYSTHVTTTKLITTAANKQICPLGARHGGSTLTVTSNIASGPAAQISAIRLSEGLTGAPSAPSIAMESWRSVGSAGEPPYQGTWVTYDAGGTRPAAFRKYPDGRVRLRGLVKSGAVPGTIFTLPVGYRPPALQSFTVDAGGGFGLVYINPDGSVVASGGLNTYIFLDTIEFDTAATHWPVGAVSPIPVVSTLPSNPYHGQEVYYQTSAMAAMAISWRLKYNAASSVNNKWECFSPIPLFANTATVTNVTSGSYVTTDSPSVALPINGIYLVEEGAVLEAALPVGGWRGRISFNSTDLDCAQAAGSGNSISAAEGGSIYRKMLKDLTAGTYTLGCRSDAGNQIAFFNRWISFTPLRVG